MDLLLGLFRHCCLGKDFFFFFFLLISQKQNRRSMSRPKEQTGALTVTPNSKVKIVLTSLL